jgi:hypothetical protein
MARQVEIKNKTNRLVFIPLSEEDHKTAEAFKKLVTQDETTIHDLMLEAIQLVFVKHHLDIGGNPQRQLLSFEQTQISKEMGVCGYAGCKQKAVGAGVYLPTSKQYKLCCRHFGDAKNNGKVWRTL